MDDILASIRKILNEDDPSAATQAPRPAPESDVVQLTPDMMVASQAAPMEPAPPPPPAPVQVPTNIMEPLPAPQPPPPELVRMPAEASAGSLVDPLAAAAAAAALGQLTRAVAQERTATVSRGGPSIEDVVREELRPLLKAWLDAHLPATVERMVRTEIERVMSRQG